MMYEVAVHSYGRRLITRDGPCQGLLEWPTHHWHRITPRPIELNRAKALADSQGTHAVVCVWMSAEKVHDNGKDPVVPDGSAWYPAHAHQIGDDVCLAHRNRIRKSA